MLRITKLTIIATLACVAACATTTVVQKPQLSPTPHTCTITPCPSSDVMEDIVYLYDSFSEADKETDVNKWQDHLLKEFRRSNWTLRKAREGDDGYAWEKKEGISPRHMFLTYRCTEEKQCFPGEFTWEVFFITVMARDVGFQVIWHSTPKAARPQAKCRRRAPIGYVQADLDGEENLPFCSAAEEEEWDSLFMK